MQISLTHALGRPGQHTSLCRIDTVSIAAPAPSWRFNNVTTHQPHRTENVCAYQISLSRPRKIHGRVFARVTFNITWTRIMRQPLTCLERPTFIYSIISVYLLRSQHKLYMCVCVSLSAIVVEISGQGSAKQGRARGRGRSLRARATLLARCVCVARAHATNQGLAAREHSA